MKSTLIILTAILAVAITSCGPGEKPAEENSNAPKQFVRRNANDPKAKRDLEALQKAIDSMKKLDCSNPLSWYYQGGIHWIPDTINNNPLCSSYENISQLKTAWDNCTHAKNSEINFLVWHRLYTYYLEKIVRKLSGDPDFALPYWGYTDTVNVTENRTMNVIYRTTGSSLYEASRFDSVNMGYPISGATVAALDLTSLYQLRDFYLFTKTIDKAPHGAMHNYIGAGNFAHYYIWNPVYNDTVDGGLMANVPSAGFDPIFWLHHSNIDRIWQTWTNSSRGKKVTLKDLERMKWPYVFFDENGKKIEFTLEQVIDTIYKLDYRFDDVPMLDKPAEKQGSKMMLAAALQDTLIQQKISKTMAANTMSFTLNNTRKKKVMLMNKVGDNNGKNIIMTLKVSFTKEPRGVFQVYVNQPKGQAPDTKSNYFAGFMTFFGASHHAMHGEDKLTAGSRVSETFEFDLTDEFGATNALDADKMEISIFRAGGNAPEEITVEDVSITGL